MELRFRSQMLLLLSIFMAFTLSACGGGSSENASSETDTAVEDIVDDEVDTTEEIVAEEEAETTEDLVVEEETDITEDTAAEEEAEATEDLVVEEETDTTEDTVVEEGTDATEDPVVEEETDATEDTIVEEETEITEEIIVEEMLVEDGLLKLRPKFTQKDIDSVSDRVELVVGHAFEGLNPTSNNPKLSIESQLKLQPTGTEATWYNLKNEIQIHDGFDHFNAALGLFYEVENNRLAVTNYLERRDPETNQLTKSYSGSFSNEVGDYFFDYNVDADESYLFKLEYDMDAEKIYGYLNGALAVTWDFENIDRQHDSVRGPVSVKLNVTSSIVYRSPEDASIYAGDAFNTEVDNLKIVYDGNTIVDDRFEAETISSQDYSYLDRLSWNYESKPQSFESTGLLTKNPWYVVQVHPDSGCLGRIDFENNQATITKIGEEQELKTIVYNYQYDQYDQYGDVEIEEFDDWEFNYSYTSTGFIVDSSIVNIPNKRVFLNRDDALDYADLIDITDCEEILPL